MTTTAKPKRRNDTTTKKSVKRKVVSAATPNTNPFPTELLPEVLANYVSDAARAIPCDPSYVALPLLASVARAIGNKRVIQIKSSWTEPAIIWGAIVADSSERKSPAFKSGTRFLVEKENNTIPNCDGSREHFIFSDSTYAALKDRLSSQLDTSLLHNPDELIGVLRSLGRGGQNAMTKGQWLSCWSGDRMTVFRGVGKTKVTVNIPRASVGIVGTIQPIAFQDAVVKERFMDDGLCPRFLLVWQPAPQRTRWNPKGMRAGHVDQVRSVFRFLFNLEIKEFEGLGYIKPIAIKLSPDAQQEWKSFYNRHNKEAEQLDKHYKAAWGKLEAYAARLALIFYLVDDAVENLEYGNQGSYEDELRSEAAWLRNKKRIMSEIRRASLKDDHPPAPAEKLISASAMQRAIQLVEWFKGETRKGYRLLAETKQETEQRELVEFIRRKGGSIEVRELYRSSSKYNSPQKAQLALNNLVKAGFARRKPIPAGQHGGQPTEIYQLIDRD